MRVHGDQRGIGRNQRSFRFGNERGIPGEVDKVNSDFLGRTGGAGRRRGPFGVSEARLNGYFPRHLLVVPIGGGAAIRNFSPPRRHARGVQQRRHQLRLAGAAVTYNANVSDVLGEIGFHANSTFSAIDGRSRRKSAAWFFKRGPAPEQIFNLGGRACLCSRRTLCGSFPPVFEGPWVSERAEAKENRKIPWNALLSRRMLAQGFAGGNEGRRKKRQNSLRGSEIFSDWNCGKSCCTRTKLQGLVPGKH